MSRAKWVGSRGRTWRGVAVFVFVWGNFSLEAPPAAWRRRGKGIAPWSPAGLSRSWAEAVDRCVPPNPGARGGVWEREQTPPGESVGTSRLAWSLSGSVSGAVRRPALREPEVHEPDQRGPGRRACHPAPPCSAFSSSVQHSTARLDQFPSGSLQRKRRVAVTSLFSALRAVTGAQKRSGGGGGEDNGSFI